MYFSEKKRQAIVNLVNLMTIADGNVDAKEVVFSFSIFSKLGVSADDISNAEHLDNQETLSIISAMQPNEKRIVVAILGAIMIADGKIDDKEQALIDLITIICNLPIMSFEEGKKEIEKLLLEIVL